MFPFVERKRRVDEYGETIDVASWMKKGKVLEESNQEGKELETMDVDEDAVRNLLHAPMQLAHECTESSERATVKICNIKR
jgi:cleavage and polyadenylation specificity factor subunit 2